MRWMEFGDSGFWCLWEMTREKQAIRDTKEKRQKPKKKNEKQKKTKKRRKILLTSKNELVSENFKVYILSSIQD